MMRKQRPTFRLGFTLIEIMISMAVLLIIISVVGVVLGDGAQDWNRMYDRTSSKLAADSLGAPRAFNAIIRKAGGQRVLINSTNDALEVYYYASPSSTKVDLYARLYLASGKLYLEEGQLSPRQMQDSRIVCENVSACQFEQLGRCLQMVLTLNDGTQSRVVTTSAFIHNN